SAQPIDSLLVPFLSDLLGLQPGGCGAIRRPYWRRIDCSAHCALPSLVQGRLRPGAVIATAPPLGEDSGGYLPRIPASPALVDRQSDEPHAELWSGDYPVHADHPY